MKILGISAHYHDAAAALLIDGVPVAAVQEERLSRRKNDAAFPLAAIEWCLDHAALEPEDLDAIIFYFRLEDLVCAGAAAAECRHDEPCGHQQTGIAGRLEEFSAFHDCIAFYDDTFPRKNSRCQGLEIDRSGGRAGHLAAG